VAYFFGRHPVARASAAGAHEDGLCLIIAFVIIFGRWRLQRERGQRSVSIINDASASHLKLSPESDNENGKLYKYVYITTNEPDTKL